MSVDGLDGATMTVAGSDNPPAGSTLVDLEPDRARAVKVYITAPMDAVTSGRSVLRFTVTDTDDTETNSYKTTFEAP